MSIALWPEGAPHAKGDSPEDRPSLTPYPVESAHPTGAVVICPGGGYQVRASHEGEPVARWLNGIGITAFVLHYRVAPYRHPCPLLDAQRAIRYVRFHAKRWNVDPHKIGILGFSAGGHLASVASTHFDGGIGGAEDPIDRESCRPDLTVLCYPVITFGEHRHHGSMVNLIGEIADETMRRSLSSELQVGPGTPPAFLWHTADDSGVPAENSMLYAGALSRHRIPYELHIFPHGKHGLGLAEHDPHVGQWTRLCGQWLKKHGF